MPIKLSDLKKRERSITMNYDGDTLEISYRASGYTAEVEDEAQKSFEHSRPGGSTAKILSELLLGWDVLDDEGAPMETDYKTLALFPTVFLNDVLMAIVNDQQAEREDRKNSGGGSLRRAR